MSPDIIVLPFLPLETYEQRQQFEYWVKLMPAITIGPGLGRDPKLLEHFEFVLECLNGKIVVGDADFFWFICQDKKKYKKHLNAIKKLVLTPNSGELVRLYKHLLNQDFQLDKINNALAKAELSGNDVVEIDIFSLIPEFKELFKYFDAKNCSFILKGEMDIILSESKCLVTKNNSSLKRSGGQGDILCGIATLYSLWCDNKDIDTANGLALASFITRQASFAAFKKHKLGMVAEDMIGEVTKAINEFVDDEHLFDAKLFGFTKI